METKIALITGASRGIGAAIAMALGSSGLKIYGTATTNDGVELISSYLKQNGIEGKGMLLDVADYESISNLEFMMASLSDRPSVLINNAGITRDNLLIRMSLNDWTDVFAANLHGVQRLSKIFLRNMIKRRWGRIINISSVVGSIGNPGQTNYSASKAGLEGFSRSLAVEVASRNITVNVISPGFINTDMTEKIPLDSRDAMKKRIPLERFGTPEEVAEVVVFLASEQANYITGENIHVNGGMYMS
ncbi:MAG: 3-oxoacyl-ACP reductase FabG [Cellvibrionales bacterium TMED148]|nr:3-oxoacyl-ACP reductase [Porticoccaceae bacterium]RPG89224.1 MAG: 3-oxoacyl-ACP reductase FabG [Cellvibrionales bacterium TMED148]